MQLHTDEQLMSFLQKGSESAFNELYDRYSNRILFFMYKLLQQDEARAQDFTQDVFLKVIENAERFDTAKSFKTWIFTIAANHCKNYFRSAYSNTIDIDRIEEESTEEELGLYDKERVMTVLSTEIDRLASPYKETFVLRYSEDLKIKEIAEIMDCPVGTIKSRLNHAVKQVTEKMLEYKSLLKEHE